MATFTQRHYVRIAETLFNRVGKNMMPADYEFVCVCFAKALQEDNKRFKPHLFYAACGAIDLWRATKPAPKSKPRKGS